MRTADRHVSSYTLFLFFSILLFLFFLVPLKSYLLKNTCRSLLKRYGNIFLFSLWIFLFWLRTLKVTIISVVKFLITWLVLEILKDKDILDIKKKSMTSKRGKILFLNKADCSIHSNVFLLKCDNLKIENLQRFIFSSMELLSFRGFF